ncbi:glycosyltransferase family 4 protein [Vibrio sp. JC009]|uniref:glycosyltransferase family 4 protein n=1 Tax=Vibrio sp. JC009 TaxID=2912314 RepID=UPI0023AE8C09|nr:glycosyltransferase family 1 protein [Vibrio sp. JC009]WED21997.1 glycosyltransferase family 4 protein [Vibrio sp. JC009]
MNIESSSHLSVLENKLAHAYFEEIKTISSSDVYEIYLKPISSVFPNSIGNVLVINSNIENCVSNIRSQAGLNAECFELTGVDSDVYADIMSCLDNYSSNSFEAIVLIDCFSRISNEESEQVSKRLSEVLKDGGICICSFANPDYFYRQGIIVKSITPLSFENSTKLFLNAGLEKSKCVDSVNLFKGKEKVEHRMLPTYLFVGKKNGGNELGIISYDEMFADRPFSGEPESTKKNQLEIAKLHTELTLQKNELDLIYNSLSWKITYPFRRIFNAVSSAKSCMEYAVNKDRQCIYIDISQLVHVDSKTGIQRVVWNIIRSWGHESAVANKLKLIYSFGHENCYWHATRFVEENFSDTKIISDVPDAEPVKFKAGDIFLGLDFQPTVIASNASLLQDLKEIGVNIQFILYDILPIRFPHFFPKVTDQFRKWVDVISSSDHVICISETVKNDYAQWLEEQGIVGGSSPKLDHFILGSDAVSLSESTPAKLSQELDSFVANIQAKKSFLMVGTLEPRKAHEQVLRGFELLWNKGEDINLVIVGKKGWMSEGLAHKILAHEEFSHHLYWLEGVSDELLNRMYSSSSALIAASYGEGVGLPLVEAAQNSLPVIARNIPVFKEVAGEGAYYFSDERSPETISACILDWISLYNLGAHPKPALVPRVSWKESAKSLLDLVLK